MVQLNSLKKSFYCVMAFLVVLAILVLPVMTPTGKLLHIASAQPTALSKPPAIEWLKFQVPSVQQTQFIEQDAAIWTPVLSSYPGFQSKEIWTNPAEPDELVIVIHWASFEQWQAIPQDVLDRTTQRFHTAMGAEFLPESMGFRLAWRSDLE